MRAIEQIGYELDLNGRVSVAAGIGGQAGAAAREGPRRCCRGLTRMSEASYSIAAEEIAMSKLPRLRALEV